MNRIDCENILTKFCEEQNILCNSDMLTNFYDYYTILVSENEKYNLTSITDMQEVYIKHFADCVYLSKFIPQNSTVCDIGTGAGFPGLVLKIIRPDIKLTLVDSLNKRVNFLNTVVTNLNLENVQCLHFRAEDDLFKNKYLNSFDCVVSRAVAKLNTLVEYCLPYVKKNGLFLAMKGPDIDNEIIDLKKGYTLLGSKKFEKISYKLFDMERVIVVFDKVDLTNKKYPRNQNKPRTNPLS